LVVVGERLVVGCSPPGVSDAVLLVVVALVGFDDDEVDDDEVVAPVFKGQPGPPQLKD